MNDEWKFCSMCGGRMITHNVFSHYDRRTGEEVRENFWACENYVYPLRVYHDRELKVPEPDRSIIGTHYDQP